MALEIVGHAIVSADGMIADGKGLVPATLRHEADWARFQHALDHAALVVLGRLGHRRHPNPGRRRLVLTSSVPRFAADPDDSRALLWNPAGAGFAAVLEHLGITEGTIAITGGTKVFAHFAAMFTSFDLAEVNGLVLPGGTPTFPDGHPRVVLAANGLMPVETIDLDAAGYFTLTRWVRPQR